MSNVKFSQLPNQGVPTDGTIIPTVDAGVNYTVTGANLKTFVNSTTGNITAGNLITGGQVTATGNITGGNIRTVGAVSATGNVTANFYFGNGSQLTGLPATYSNANVAAYLPTYSGTLTANTVSATGNITTAGFFVGNFQGNISGNLTVPGLNTQVLYNNNGNAGASSGLTFASNVLTVGANVQAVNLRATGVVSATGNITGNYLFGNISQATGGYNNTDVQNVLQTYSGTLTAGSVSAVGNIAGNYIFGNGALLTGISTTLSGNLQGNINGNGFQISNVSAVAATGNITGNFFQGNGAALTGIPTSIVAGTGISVNASTGAVTITNNNPNPYTNANVAAYLPTYTGNIGAGNAAITGRITAGTISATGNINAGNIIGTHWGSGGNLTEVVTAIQAGNGISINSSSGAVTITNTNPIPYANANVASYLATANIPIQASTITCGNINSTGLIFTTNAVQASGNITGTNIVGTHFGNGATLSNIVTSITAGTGINVSASTGSITISSNSSANLTVNNLTVNGNITKYAELTYNAGTVLTSYTPDFNNGPVQKLLLSQPFTLNNPLNMPTGGSMTLILTQGASGNDTMTPSSFYKFAYGVNTLSVAGNAIDVMSIFYDGNNYLCNLVKGYV